MGDTTPIPTEDDAITIASYVDAYWVGKARDNVSKWGIQSSGTLLLAIAEEVGEMADELIDLDTEMQCDGDKEDCYSVEHALIDVAELGSKIQKLHEDVYEDADGNPSDGPELYYDTASTELGEELADTAALLYQLQARHDMNVTDSVTDRGVQKDTADESEHHHGYDIDKAVSYSDRQ